MQSYFKISQVSAVEDRVPISFKVREYFEKFITENVLIPKNIIINGKWNVIIGIIFISEGKYGPKNIFMAKGGARTVIAESVKIYEIVIPLRLIQDSKTPLLKAVESIYEALKIFLITTYKKVTPEFMNELWKLLDLDYLLSLPYPAPLEEQKYIGDIESNGEIIIQVR